MLVYFTVCEKRISIPIARESRKRNCFDSDTAANHNSRVGISELSLASLPDNNMSTYRKTGGKPFIKSHSWIISLAHWVMQAIDVLEAGREIVVRNITKYI